MAVNDPIADMLTRIRNASQARHPEVTMPSSRQKVSVAQVLKDTGYVEEFRVEGEGKKTLTIVLKYQGKTPVIEGLKRVSGPAARIYVSCDKIPRVQGGLGTAIISTSSGTMTDRAARKANLGGELVCYVW